VDPAKSQRQPAIRSSPGRAAGDGADDPLKLLRQRHAAKGN